MTPQLTKLSIIERRNSPRQPDVVALGNQGSDDRYFRVGIEKRARIRFQRYGLVLSTTAYIRLTREYGEREVPVSSMISYAVTL